MKKLIAQRPIQYMDRIYECGEAVPAQDLKMVAAWLRAGSAAWSGTESPQDTPNNKGGQEPVESENTAQEGRNASETGEIGQSGGTSAMLTGHLDAADLEKWKKTDLEKLAEDMGVDISEARNNAERAAILAAVEVQAPADSPDDDGGSQ